VHHLQGHVGDALLDGIPFENLTASYLEVMHVEQAIYDSAQERGKIML